MAEQFIEQALRRFPKSRLELPPRYKAIYERMYQENRSGQTAATSMAQRLEAWMHHCVAADVNRIGARSTLEIGAGTLNQLPYEPSGAIYDVVEPFRSLFENSPHLLRVRHVFSDISEAPMDSNYQRITSIAALEHVADLPVLLARSALLLNEGGCFRAAIPSEGGFLWRLGWNATTGMEFRLRHGLDYGVIMKHEHLNAAAEIEALVCAVYEKVEVRSFGVGLNLSLYRFIEARRPRLDVANTWIARFKDKAPEKEVS